MAKKIAVIDDSREFVDMVQTMLEQAGYEVIPIVESLKASNVIRREKPDLIILDIMMPGRSGWEVLDMTKLDPATKGIPVIVTSAAMISMRAQAKDLERRGVELLPKPFSIDDLLGKVERLIGKSQ
ncbi:MAG: response regulator [Dehalococcoidales bacterium]|nr:response regulator [Dehalococcoidales bacterium]